MALTRLDITTASCYDAPPPLHSSSAEVEEGPIVCITHMHRLSNSNLLIAPNAGLSQCAPTPSTSGPEHAHAGERCALVAGTVVPVEPVQPSSIDELHAGM